MPEERSDEAPPTCPHLVQRITGRSGDPVIGSLRSPHPLFPCRAPGRGRRLRRGHADRCPTPLAPAAGRPDGRRRRRRSRAGAPHPPARVWYVDDASPDGGDGFPVAPSARSSVPARASDVDDTVYVFLGDDTARGLDEGIRLEPRQMLHGSGVALTTTARRSCGRRPAPLTRRGASWSWPSARRGRVAIAGGGAGAEAGIRARGRAVSVRSVRIEGGSGLGVGLSCRTSRARRSPASPSRARAHAVLVERSGASRSATAGGPWRRGRRGRGAPRPRGHVELGCSTRTLRPARGGYRCAVRNGPGRDRAGRHAGAVGGGGGGHRRRGARRGHGRPRGGDRAGCLSGLALTACWPGRRARRAWGSASGSGYLGEAQGTRALAVHASERASLRLEVTGNDLLASELALFVTDTCEAAWRPR